MIGGAKPGHGVRTLRELALALRSRSFRVALLLSLLLHLLLFGLLGRWVPAPPGEGERRIPLMRVRLLPRAP